MLPFGEVLVSIYEEGPEILSSLHFEPFRGWLASTLYSIFNMLLIGEVLVQIGQPGAELLRSLHLVLLSLFPQYLQGRLSIGGYFFTRKEHFYSYMEVGWPKNWLALEDGKKCST